MIATETLGTPKAVRVESIFVSKFEDFTLGFCAQSVRQRNSPTTKAGVNAAYLFSLIQSLYSPRNRLALVPDRGCIDHALKQRIASARLQRVFMGARGSSTPQFIIFPGAANHFSKRGWVPGRHQ